MKRALLLVCLIAAAACAARAQIPFYTEDWYWLDPSYWTVRDGTAYTDYRLYDDGSAVTLVSYVPATPSQNYSVQTEWIYGDPGSIYHYLRVSETNPYNHYRVEFSASWPPGAALVRIWRSWSVLAQTYITSGTTLKSSILGNTITVYVNGTPLLSTTDSTYPTGKPGVGTCGFTTSGGIGLTVLSSPETQPPTVPNGLHSTLLEASRVGLAWNPSTDNVGVVGYKVYRCAGDNCVDGSYIGSSVTTSYTDLFVDPGTTYNYRVTAYDAALNESAKSAPLEVTTLPSSYAVPDTGGPVAYAATWGAGPETVSLLTGGLSVRLPLLKLQHRARGPGFQMLAAWSSQFWSWETGPGTTMIATDVGYGLGFIFQIAAVYPKFSGDELVRYEYQDAAGVIHRLEPTGTAYKYKSQDSTYLLWDEAARTLTFTDGTVWFFDCTSRYPEADAGTRYPTRLRDSNGNLIDITYAPASGMTATNTSARIQEIKDTLTTYTWVYDTINGAPHVTRVYHWQTPEQQFNDAIFTYDTASNIVSPFGLGKELGGQPLTRVRLKEVSFTGAVGPFKFDYNDSAEITKITFPYKGYFRYVYTTAHFSNEARLLREIGARYMNDNTASGEQLYEFSHPAGDTALALHTETTLLDPPGNKKVWQFIHGGTYGWDNGLPNRYEAWQGPSSFVLKQGADSVWTQDNPSSPSLSNPRVPATTSTSTEGGVSFESKVERDIDPATGNTTQVREYAYGNLTTPARTTTTTYVSNSNYTSRNILNLPSNVTVCEGPGGCGTPASSTDISYDQGGLYAVPGINQHDASYGTSFYYRGNPSTINANGLSVGQYYDIGGNLRSTTDAMGHTVSSASYSATTGQVSSATAGTNTTTLAWNADTTLASTTGSNNDPVSFTYSSYRPTSVQHPDGTYTYFSYNDAANPVTETETSPMNSVTVRTRDGFGRVIKTAARLYAAPPEYWIYTETQYSACSCSSTGKAVKQSRPYGTGGTPVWTESTFDALGRTARVTLPDGAHTDYAYSVENSADWKGTVTTITDPLGKQKRYLYGAFGRLLRVDEQNTGGTLVETARYTYDTMGRLLTVRMGKINETTFKQTRTFVYNTKGQLLSATNPENGTVTYTYRTDGLLQSKTDAKSQALWYAYDSYHRLQNIQSPQGTVKVSFGYDSGQYAVGRMTSAYSYTSGYTNYFTYDVMGRVTTQTLQYPNVNQIQAQYEYDDDGRMTHLRYPGTPQPYSPATGVDHMYVYDTLGRPYNLWYDTGGGNWSMLAQASYNAAGQLTSLAEFYGGGVYRYGTRTYDPLRGSLTRATFLNTAQQQMLLDLTYGYRADGRVSSVTDAVNPGQSVSSYGYDQLNRLTGATATNWAMQWSYDEFGNRLTQAGTGNPAPPAMTLAYDEATNRITTAGYSYDLNGNLEHIPQSQSMPEITDITWDLFDRMTQSTANGTTTEYKYDAFGRRVARVTPSGTDTFFYDMGGRLLATYRWSNPSTPELTVYMAGQKLGQYTDRIGSVRYANTGGVVSHYYPYGELVAGASNTGFKFAETYRDDSGLDYALNRYYASGVGRFLSVDPYGGSASVTEPQSLNRYTYAGNDPANQSDPSGLMSSWYSSGGETDGPSSWSVDFGIVYVPPTYVYVPGFPTIQGQQGPGPYSAPTWTGFNAKDGATMRAAQQRAQEWADKDACDHALQTYDVKSVKNALQKIESSGHNQNVWNGMASFFWADFKLSEKITAHLPVATYFSNNKTRTGAIVSYTQWGPEMFLGYAFFDPSLAGVDWGYYDAARALMMMHEAVHLLGRSMDDDHFGGSKALTNLLIDKCFPIIKGHLGGLVH